MLKDSKYKISVIYRLLKDFDYKSRFYKPLFVWSCTSMCTFINPSLFDLPERKRRRLKIYV